MCSQIKTHAFVPCPENRWGIFITGSGDFVRLSHEDDNAPGYDITTGNFTLGVDYRIGDHFAIGIDGGYLGSTARLVDNGRIEGDGEKLGGYITASANGFFGSKLYVDLAGSGGWNNYDTRRSALLGEATGETDGTEWNGLLAYGADWTFGGFTVGTWSSLQYTSIDLNGFGESGSRAPLEFRIKIRIRSEPPAAFARTTKRVSENAESLGRRSARPSNTNTRRGRIRSTRVSPASMTRSPLKVRRSVATPRFSALASTCNGVRASPRISTTTA